MKSIDDLKKLELLAGADTPIHRLDPRAKVLVTLVFIISIISFGRYELAALLPFIIFPVAMATLAALPMLYIVKKVAIIIPLVLVIGIFNPLFDREIILKLGELDISAGWISLASIIVRSALTIGAAFILIGTTGFISVCQALERIGMPQVFSAQLLFLYRYIFVLNDEGSRAARARDLRSFGKRGSDIRSFCSLTGHLLLRTWQRAERIHMAMLARGFVGRFHSHRSSCFGVNEFKFVFGWIAVFILMRTYNISELLGVVITGMRQ
jgi:cobalt/nickel transport system permease protein